MTRLTVFNPYEFYKMNDGSIRMVVSSDDKTVLCRTVTRMLSPGTQLDAPNEYLEIEMPFSNGRQTYRVNMIGWDNYPAVKFIREHVIYAGRLSEEGQQEYNRLSEAWFEHTRTKRDPEYTTDFKPTVPDM